MPRLRPKRTEHRWLVALALAGTIVGEPALARASWPAAVWATMAPRNRRKAVPLSSLVERTRDAERSVVAAERAAASEVVPSEGQLAKQLVAGQLRLSEGDYEGSAIMFLDLVENHPNSQAAPQAVYFLGEALIELDMARWSAELFSKNLSDDRPEARRFHQRSVARLFDLATPRREAGFARRPGLSATPEVRARLTSLGIKVNEAPPSGIIAKSDRERLERWAQSFAPENRDPELRYALGRYYYLTDRHREAIAELDALSPLDIPMSRGGPAPKWRIRAAYIAAAASLSTGDIEDALDRFRSIGRAKPNDPGDRQIVELAWLAQGRIHHDLDEVESSVRAYRAVGRDSPFFAEAMYETAWTLLRAEEYEQALQALELLLIYDPESPIIGEIKQLRGKVKIQQRDYPGAEAEFLTLRREFDRLTKQLERKLQGKGDATAYFAAVVGEDMEHFSLASLLPVAALPVARGLPRAMQAASLAQQVGELERELDDTRSLLARMEEAVAAREKARLFNDLGAHAAALDAADDELVEVQEELVLRLGREAQGAGLDRLETTRQQLRRRLDEPLGAKGADRAQLVERLETTREQIHKLDLTIGALRAELVATERYYEETRKDQKIDHQGFLTQAAQMRSELRGLERDAARLRDVADRAQASLRYRDPLRQARNEALSAYRAHLSSMYAALRQKVPDAEVDTLWQRTARAQQRGNKAKESLEVAGTDRLAETIEILQEERVNLDTYLAELAATKGRTQTLVAEVLEASYRDVVGELGNLVLRSEVGLLDVAWGMKEAESEEVQRLERERDRDLRALDDMLELGLEEVGP